MADAAVDVDVASGTDAELAGGVAFVFNRQQGRGQKRRLALTAVGVAGEHPALKIVPEPGQIAGVGVVGKHDGRRIFREMRNDGAGRKIGTPKIVEAGEVEAVIFDNGVAEGKAARFSQNLGVGLRDVRAVPIRAVIMVAQNPVGAEAAGGKGFHDLPRLCLNVGTVVGHEVAGVDDEVGLQIAHPVKNGAQVIVGHLVTDVQVAELHEQLARKFSR